jgi:pilus assembly protein Flp/PilA
MFAYLATFLRSRSDQGATAVEYGLMVALIAAIIVGIVGTLGGQVQAAFQAVSDAL